jgi:hypothetical protein
MKGYGLIESPETTPRIRIGLVADYLRTSLTPEAAADQVAETREDIIAWVNRRRDRVERRLRGLVSDGLSLNYGAKRATEHALSALNERRRGELMQYSYQGMWAKTYFPELIAILQREWVLFQNKFAVDRDEAIKWLNQVNACRWDAHAAEELPDEDVAYLKVCFRRLEERLDLLDSPVG